MRGEIQLTVIFSSLVPPRSVCRMLPTFPSWPCSSCTCWRDFLGTSPSMVRLKDSYGACERDAFEWITCLLFSLKLLIQFAVWRIKCKTEQDVKALFAFFSLGAVESELLHTYIRVDPLDVLILCVRLAVLVAVTLTVPVVLFPVRVVSYFFLT